MSHHTEGDRIAMTIDDHPEEETPFPFAYEDDGGIEEEEDFFAIDDKTYARERAEEREYAIREQSVGVAMQLNSTRSGSTVETIIADAEKIAAYLRGKAA